MKRMITSSENVIDKYLHNSVTDTSLVNNFCSMLVSMMYEQPSLTFFEAFEQLKQDVSNLVDKVPGKLHSDGVWDDDDSTLYDNNYE